MATPTIESIVPKADVTLHKAKMVSKQIESKLKAQILKVAI